MSIGVYEAAGARTPFDALFELLGIREPRRRTPQQRLLDNAWDRIYEEGEEVYPTAYSFFKHVRESFKKRGVRTVVDAACGGSARHIAPLIREGFEVVGGFDLSPKALELTREALVRQGLPVPPLVQQDMFERPWPFQGVDAVLLIQSLYHGYSAEILTALDIVAEDVLNRNGTLIATFTGNKYRALRGVEIGGFTEDQLNQVFLHGDRIDVLVDERVLTEGQVVALDSLFEEPERNTFIPKVGREAGLPHHIFAADETFALFADTYSNVHIYEDPRLGYRIVDARRNGNSGGMQ